MNEVELRRLISAWLDETIEPERFRALAGALRDDPDARRVYFEAMATHAELCNQADGERYLEQLVVDAAVEAGAGRASRSRPAWRWYALAASVLVAVGVWYATERTGRRADHPAETLAEALPAGDGCRWYVEHATREPSPAVRCGDVVRVASGGLTLRYRNGVEVRLQAPAAYELVSTKHARLLLGRLTAEVSEQGKGFTVSTPRARVLDLGTEFGVNVEGDGATDVVVFKGTVDVDYPADGSGENRAQRLLMGEAVHLDAAGAASRIASIRSGDYAGSSGARPAAPVIETVRDNFDRMASLNFYEIVPGGMGEDALAFVDREAHEWNGVDASGMPPYLVGCDYVKTFNSDKFNRDIRIRVSLACAARLYVLFDNRLDPPAWLREGFEDTGDDVGLDVGRFRTNGQWHNEGPAGVGPGESVEDVFSVWVREVDGPRVVTLGSTEAPQSEPNMYGIAAAPLSTAP